MFVSVLGTSQYYAWTWTTQLLPQFSPSLARLTSSIPVPPAPGHQDSSHTVTLGLSQQGAQHFLREKPL